MILSHKLKYIVAVKDVPFSISRHTKTLDGSPYVAPSGELVHREQLIKPVLPDGLGQCLF
jgi:hypothetical protein